MAEPRCKYFGRCGGCTAQHIDYELQLSNKQKAVADAAGVEAASVQAFSGKEYCYRNRMDFLFHAGGLGFRKKADWKSIVDVAECSISNDKLNTILSEIRNHFKGAEHFDVRRKTGTYRYAVIRTPTRSSSVSFVLNPDSKNLGDAIENIKRFAEKSTADNIIITYVKPDKESSTSEDFFVVKGEDMLHEKLMGKEFIFPVQGFFQNNTAVANRMHEYVHELLEAHKTSDAHLLDLYAGVGTFGINNASLFKGVTLVEGYEKSIETAKKNIELSESSDIEAFALDDSKIKNLELPSPLFVVTDPPRSGMNPKTIQWLNRQEPEVIIYISCNPAQM
ncbi:RsmD family RNA methyltransferase, partial [Candidatus Woesearchaeota archaeon]|nr:RsmD family RNA methyltransferase [Candidatus Woesearchaeota archaeon]